MNALLKLGKNVIQLGGHSKVQRKCSLVETGIESGLERDNISQSYIVVTPPGTLHFIVMDGLLKNNII